MNADAALDAARVAFDASIGQASADATRAPEWRDLAQTLAAPHGRGAAMWSASERVLQTVVGRAELTGQALVGEARRLQFLTLSDAHALVALQGWVDGLRDAAEAVVDAPPTDVERAVAREAWMALEHAANRPHAAPPASAPLASAPLASAPSAYAPPASTSRATSAPPAWAADSALPGGLQGAAAWEAATPSRKKWYATPGFLVGMLALLLAVGAGGWMLRASRREQDFAEGVAAYERGARAEARGSFERAIAQRPDDARPLIFLGRIAREDGDVASARRLLDAAVRLDPNSGAAQRELAAALLADGQPELARRFYVRAIELDPSDRLAQGFLACALYRLGRVEESRRWSERAGSGSWTSCVTAPMPPPPGVP